MKYLLALILLFPFAVSAEQVAVISDNGDSIELHDRLHNKCPEGIKEAIYKWRNGRTVEGCWKVIVDRDAVYVVFFDGDAMLIPINGFTWKRGSKPATL